MRAPALALMLTLLVAAPAEARRADPGRSVVMVQAPRLAPGTNGSAPLYGELRDQGSFVLVAPVSGVSTGNAVHDTLIKQVLRGSVTLESGPPRLTWQNGIVRRFVSSGTLKVGASASRVPLTIRTITKPEGIYMQTYCLVPLAPYGVVGLNGAAPGDVRVAINAFFPR